MYTQTFFKTAKAYRDGYRFIENRGGSRSGKTFGELQALDIIARTDKPRIITVVSHSLPHLEGGAIRDYDKILQLNGIQPDQVRTKRPYIYHINKSIIEFIGFDAPGKALGAARDILFINECNKMEWGIVHQLIQRTTECVFMDYNPASKFWMDDADGFDIQNRKDAISIHSTFEDNRDNLTDGQLAEFALAKQKAQAESERGVYGYWSNWWKVYGLGEYGQIEGAIYTDWEIGDFDATLPVRFGLDFGFSSDPDALIKIAVNEKTKTIYLHECIYRNGQSFETLKTALSTHCKRYDYIIADSAEDRLISDLSRHFNVRPTLKWKVIERIKKMQSYHLVVTPESVNLQKELMEYVWSDKKSETPIDKSNHLLDAAGYALTGQSPQIKSRISL